MIPIIVVQAQNNKSVDGEPSEAVLVPMNLEFVKVFKQPVGVMTRCDNFENYFE